MLTAQEPRQPSLKVPSASRVDSDRRGSCAPVEDGDDGSLEQAASLREGETRMCMMGPGGALFETDYLHESNGERMFSVLWLNADASGFMDEAGDDCILAVRY